MPSFMQKLPHFLSLPFFSLSIHQSFHSSSHQVFSLTRLSTRPSVCLLSISSNSSIPPIHQTVLWCCVEANETEAGGCSLYVITTLTAISFVSTLSVFLIKILLVHSVTPGRLSAP